MYCQLHPSCVRVATGPCGPTAPFGPTPPCNPMLPVRDGAVPSLLCILCSQALLFLPSLLLVQLGLALLVIQDPPCGHGVLYLPSLLLDQLDLFLQYFPWFQLLHHQDCPFLPSPLSGQRGLFLQCFPWGQLLLCNLGSQDCLFLLSHPLAQWGLVLLCLLFPLAVHDYLLAQAQWYTLYHCHLYHSPVELQALHLQSLRVHP